MKSTISIFHWLVFVCIVGAHFLFISADPPTDTSYSRAPFNDEGLYSAQVRNYLYHGKLNLEEGDAVLKGPLYSGIIYLTLSAYGDHREAIRGLTLFSFLLFWSVSFYCFKGYRQPLLLLAPILISNYYFFHFSHYGLVEVIIAGYMLWGCLYVGTNMSKRRLGWKYLFFYSAIFSIPVLLKAQYFYTPLLLPFILLASFIIEKERFFFKKFLQAILVLMITGSILYSIWVLPHHNLFYYFMERQSGEIASLTTAFKNTLFNINYAFINVKNGSLLLLFVWAVVLSLRQKKVQIKSKEEFVLLSFCSWLIFECSKLTLAYYPTRYFLCTLIAIAFIAAILVTRYFPLKVSLTIAGLFVVVNGFFIYRSYQSRQYSLQTAQRYIKTNIRTDKPILGNWATNLVWGLPNKTVWISEEFIPKEENLLENYAPEAIIVEHQNTYFSKHSIDLPSLSDSSRCFHIGDWDVDIYWLKNR